MNHDDSLFSTDSHTLRRLLAALGRTDQAALPVDLLTIAHTVEQALARRLDLPERAWVDITTTKLRGHVHLLLREDLGDTDAPPARAVHREAYALLDPRVRPGPDTPPFTAYEHLRALAAVAESLTALYRSHRTGKER
ncbi:DUF6415 family natural product biosynthesis protein [Streptomyces sp. NBC_01317]|uniref:DUF6415 family natural product biosynthesis protein n=1 Tax=Streptomyces sp. NBC_01317 TaxID=2903822 RepID=UPI002E0E5EAF|nr:DUF6415 family natural product biosynthesis protein [Streptomyces sp. NBC_01317]